jgi:signal transduction histidine kinase
VLVALYVLRMRQVTATLHRRFDIRVAERERIARELHDTLLQGFQGLMLQMKAGVNRLPDPVARQPLDEALQLAQAVLIEGRDRVRDLRALGSPRELAQELLASAAAILDYADGPRVHLTAEGESRDLHAFVQEEVIRIYQEAMSNIRQHARATEVDVLLVWDRGRLSLMLRDNGVGIPPEILARGERPRHYGLRGMRERAERIGGRLVVNSQVGDGTEVALVIPGRTAYRDYAARRFGVDGLMRRINRLLRP